ncbi:MAG: ribonuclease E activity regulator RraA [Myxococcota bacterium]
MVRPTADLYDTSGDFLQVSDIHLFSLGGKASFEGQIETLKTYEDNTKVRTILNEKGTGRVLVIDGGGSRRFALVGDRLAQLAIDNGWSGIVVYGCVRDAAILNTLPLGIRALGTTPRKTTKREGGHVGLDVTFGGVRYVRGHWLYADADGIVTSENPLDDEG